MRLVGQHRLYGKPIMVGEFLAHDSTPGLGFESRGSVESATLLAGHGSALTG